MVPTFSPSHLSTTTIHPFHPVPSILLSISTAPLSPFLFFPILSYFLHLLHSSPPHPHFLLTLLPPR
jgi:hypothetical protein